MYVNQVAYVSSANKTDQDTQVSTASRQYQKGIYSVERAGGSSSPVIKIYGKLVKSDDAAVDSGWVELVTVNAGSSDSVNGGTLDIYPHMTATVTSNTDAAVLVTIGYNEKD